MYQDSTVQTDETGITINRYGVTGARRVNYDEIETATVHAMNGLERWRLIGAGPSRFRSWYNWDGGRRTKTKAVVLDIGGFFSPTVTPDDTDAFIAAIADHVQVG